MGVVDLVIELLRLADLVGCAGVEEIHHRTQHHLDDLAHTQQLAGSNWPEQGLACASRCGQVRWRDAT